MEFGVAMKNEFILEKSCVFVNHAAFGPTPRKLVEQKVKFIYEQERQPDKWMRSSTDKYYDDSLTAAAGFLGARKDNLVLVDNVTAGINTVIKCMQLKPKDKILVHSHSFSAIKNIAKDQEILNGVEVVVVEIPIPLKSEDQLVEVFRKAFVDNSNIKVAIIDHITVTTILFPVGKLVKLCREHGIISVIDGAYAPGQVKLNLEELGADYYSGNFHKWCYVPRSCGFIWISPEHWGKIYPLITSHKYEQNINKKFSSLGTRDTSAYFCIPRALQFYRDVGGLETIQAHAKKMLKYAVDLLTKSLGTEEPDIPDSMRAPFMTTVRLPIAKPATSSEADQMTVDFYKKHNVQTTFVVINNSFYIRPSVNIYNSGADYRRFKNELVKYLVENYHDELETNLN